MKKSEGLKNTPKLRSMQLIWDLWTTLNFLTLFKLLDKILKLSSINQKFSIEIKCFTCNIWIILNQQKKLWTYSLINTLPTASIGGVDSNTEFKMFETRSLKFTSFFKIFEFSLQIMLFPEEGCSKNLNRIKNKTKKNMPWKRSTFVN